MNPKYYNEGFLPSCYKETKIYDDDFRDYEKIMLREERIRFITESVSRAVNNPIFVELLRHIGISENTAQLFGFGYYATDGFKKIGDGDVAGHHDKSHQHQRRYARHLQRQQQWRLQRHHSREEGSGYDYEYYENASNYYDYEYYEGIDNDDDDDDCDNDENNDRNEESDADGYADNLVHYLIIPTAEDCNAYFSFIRAEKKNQENGKEFELRSLCPIGKHQRMFPREALQPEDILLVVNNAFKAALVHDANGVVFVPSYPESVADFRAFLSEHSKIDEHGVKKAPCRRVIVDADIDGITFQDLAAVCDKLRVPCTYYNLFDSVLDDFDALSENIEKIERTIRKVENNDYSPALLEDSSMSSMSTYIQKYFEDAEGTVFAPVVSTGISMLDTALGGGVRDWLVLIGAETSMGKTTLLLQSAYNMARAGSVVLFYTLEMSTHDLMAKCISRLSLERRLETGESIDGMLTTDDVKDIGTSTDDKKDELRRLLADIKDQIGERLIFKQEDCTVERIKTDVLRLQGIVGKKVVVFIDYLHLMNASGSSIRERVENIIFGLCNLRKQHSVPIIAISGLNREAFGKPVELESFKETSNLNFGPDIALGFQLTGIGTTGFDIDGNMKRNPRRVEIVVLKHRHGERRKKVEFDYYPAWHFFTERNDEKYRMISKQETELRMPGKKPRRG